MAIKKNGSLNIGPGFSPNSLAYWDSTIEQWQSLEVGIEGAILVSNGPDRAPAWVPIGDISGVVSVGLTAPAALFSVSGSPVINSGTLGLSLNAQNAGQVFAGPVNGAAAAPAFRSLVSTDLPSISSLLDGLGGNQGDIAYRGATGWTVLPPGTSGAVLTTQGEGANPNWTFIGGTGTVTSVGLSMPAALFSVTGSPVVDHGTLTASLVNQNARTFFSGPVAGNPDVPSFRSIEVNDLPAASSYLDTIAATRGDILYRGAAGWTALAPGTAGQFLISGGAGNDPAWSNSGAGGTVSSVGLALPASVFNVTGSPVTNSGTLTGTFTSQFANQVFAGPANGSAAAPTFRALTTADLPALAPQLDTISNVQGSILYRSASGWVALPPGAAGQFLETQGASANPQWATGNAGTVTSVGLTAAPIFSVTGSPVVGAGTLDLALVNQNAGLALLGPVNGAAAAPSFRALATTDLPAASSYLDSISATQGAVLYRSATGWTTLPAGTPGSVLTTQGSGANPIWSNSSGTVTSVGLALPSIFNVSGSPVLGAGTLTAALANQNAGLVFASPASGAAAAPTFRALTSTDLPSISSQLDSIGSPAQGDILYRSAIGWAFLAPGTANNVLQTGGPGANPAWNAPFQPGYLNSAFGSTEGTFLFCGSGGLWQGLGPGTAGQVLTTGGSGAAPSWTTPGSGGGVTSAALDTAFGSTVGGVLVRGTSGWTNLGVGTSGQVLTSGGASANPSWTTASGGSVTAGQLPATATNDNAAAGKLGEYMQVLTGGWTPTNAGTTQLASLTLTPGDWDVQGHVAFDISGGTPQLVAAGINTTVVLTNNMNQTAWSQPSNGGGAAGTHSVHTPEFRVSINATTTYLLLGYAQWLSSGGAISGHGGYLRARRAR